MLIANEIASLSNAFDFATTLLYVCCVKVYGVVIVCAVFYAKYNSINLQYSGALIYGTVLSAIMKNLIQFWNIYQFIQRINKAYHMSFNYATLLYQFK